MRGSLRGLVLGSVTALLAFPSLAHAASHRYGLNGLALGTNQQVSVGKGSSAASLIMQNDGNLVIYVNSSPVWSSATAGSSCASGCGAYFQGDGNLVVYASGPAVWASNTSGERASSLLFQNSAPYLQIMNSKGKVLWSSGGSAPAPTPTPTQTAKPTPTPTPTPTPSPSSTGSASNGSFPIILGMNTHLFYSGYASDNAAEVQSMLNYLHISNIRDVLPDTSQIESQMAGLAAAGVKWDIITEVGGTVNTSTPISVLTTMENDFPGHLNSIEGPNEVVNWPITYNGVGGNQGAANYQEALWNAVKADSLFSGIPVYDLTMGGGTPSQMPNQAAYCNYGNAHVYPQPGAGGAQPYASLAANIAYETPYTVPDPNVVTEAGYYTMPDNQYGVNNDVQARYITDMVMDGVAQGFGALYLYELVDDAADSNNTNMEDHFGLFTYNYQPKPAATALAALTSVLNGTTLSSTKYSLSGLPSDGYSLSFSDSSGNAYLVVWAEPLIWNQNSDSETVGSTVSVKASLGGTYSSVQVYDVMSGASPINTYSSVSSVTLSITDHPVIVKMMQ
jgi:hypothetical protein